MKRSDLLVTAAVATVLALALVVLRGLASAAPPGRLDSSPNGGQHASNQTLSQIISPPVSLREGVNSVFSQAMTKAVQDGDEVTQDSRTTVVIDVCTSESEVASSLEINAQAEVSYLTFSAGTKASYFKKLNVKSHNVAIVVKSVVSRRHRLTSEPKLIGEPPADDDESVRAWYRTHGDSYVFEVNRGAAYYATYILRSTTREEQTRITGELKAKGIVGGATLSAQVSTELNNYVKETFTHTHFEQQAFGYNGAMPDKDGIVAYALEFPEKAKDGDATLDWNTRFYSTLSSLPRARFEQIELNALKFADAHRQPQEKLPLINCLARIDAVVGSIKSIEEVYEAYEKSHADPELKDHRAAAVAQADEIVNLMNTYFSNPFYEVTRPDVSYAHKGTPQLEVLTHRTHIEGGPGGVTWDNLHDLGGGDVLVTLNNKLPLKNFWVFLDSPMAYWRQLHIVYEHKGNLREMHYGDRVGHESGHFDHSGSGISKVDLWTGAFVDKIEVKFNDGRAPFIAGGNGGGGPFSLSPPDEDYVLIALKGRSGTKIDALGATYVKFLPAQWEPTVN